MPPGCPGGHSAAVSHGVLHKPAVALPAVTDRQRSVVVLQSALTPQLSYEACLLTPQAVSRHARNARDEARGTQPGRQTGTERLRPDDVRSVQTASRLQSDDVLQRSKQTPIEPPSMSKHAPRPPR